MVITSSTRNRVDGKTSRGFESHLLRQIIALFHQGKVRFFIFWRKVETFEMDINFSTPIHTPKRILQGGHLMDEFLHAVRAFLAHSVGHMAVYIKGKCGCRMAKVLLNGLDIVAVFQGDDRVGVP